MFVETLGSFGYDDKVGPLILYIGVGRQNRRRLAYTKGSFHRLKYN